MNSTTTQAFLKLLDLRYRYPLRRDPGQWDLECFASMGIHRGTGPVLKSRFDVAALEFEGLSPLLLWQSPFGDSQPGVALSGATLIGEWGANAQPTGHVPPCTKGRFEDDCVFDVDAPDSLEGEDPAESPHEELVERAWAMVRESEAYFELEQRLEADEIDAQDFEEGRRTLFEDRFADAAFDEDDCLFSAADDGQTEDIRHFSFAVAHSDNGSRASQQIFEVLPHVFSWLSRSIRLEVERALGQDHPSREANWTQSLSTALLTEVFYHTFAAPMDWAPAVIAFAKSLEMALSCSWRECLREMGCDDIIPVGRSMSFPDSRLKWDRMPGLGASIQLLALGHSRNRSQSSESLFHPIETTLVGMDWAEFRIRRERIVRDCDSNLREHETATGHKLRLLRCAQRFAQRCHDNAVAAGWRGGLGEAILVLDAFREEYRNGPAHATIMSAREAERARTLLLGRFQAYFWPDVPLFDSRNSLLALATGGTHQSKCDRGYGNVRGPIEELRSRFKERFPARTGWLADPRVAQLCGDFRTQSDDDIASEWLPF